MTMRPGEIVLVTIRAQVADVDDEGQPVRLTFLTGYSHRPVGVAAEADAVHCIAPWPCPRPDDPEGCHCPGDGPCLAVEREGYQAAMEQAGRLRSLLAEVLSSWEGLARALCAEHCDPDSEGHDGDVCGADLDTVARIRRAEGL